MNVQNSNTRLKKLFLLDGIGALVSAFMLGIVFIQFEEYFGIPISALYILAGLPCIFAIYDFYCFFRIKNQLGTHLKQIAVVNILYCCLSVGFAFYHFSEITNLGWAYIIIEVIIVIALASFELKTVNALIE